jgi:dimeric dUTPase (all-alpha-NTP-PPase superfamily)
MEDVDLNTSGDRLGAVFARQRELMDLYQNKDRGINLSLTVLALIVELGEVLQKTNWKPWKRAGEVSNEALREEISDAFHFFVQMCIMCGMNSDDLYASYFQKVKVNVQRQQEDY